MSDPQYEELPTEALIALKSGRKLEAIKIVREQTGMGIGDAASLVERASQDLGPEMPRMAAGKEDSGLVRVLVILAVLGALVGALFWL